MSDPPDPGGDRKDPLKPQASASDAPADDQRSGRIAYDERGNSVWEWKLETGVYSRDISTQRLKKLDLNDLSIADTAKHQRPPGLGDKQNNPGNQGGNQRSPGGGFNPYDNSSTGRGNVGSNPYNSGGRAALKPAPQSNNQSNDKSGEPKPPRKPLDLKKLQEWMEIRKRVQENKPEDDEDD